MKTLKLKKVLAVTILSAALMVGTGVSVYYLTKDTVVNQSANVSLSENLDASFVCNGITIKKEAFTTNEDGSITMNYTITPDNATYKLLEAKVVYSESNLDASSVITVTIDSEKKTITLKCNEAFEEKINVIISSVYDTNVSTTIVLDYQQKYLGVDSFINESGNMIGLYNNLINLDTSKEFYLNANYSTKYTKALDTSTLKVKLTDLSLTYKRYNDMTLPDDWVSDTSKTQLKALTTFIESSIKTYVSAMQDEDESNDSTTELPTLKEISNEFSSWDVMNIVESYNNNGALLFGVSFKVSIDGIESDTLTTTWRYKLSSQHASSELEELYTPMTDITLSSLAYTF